MELTAIVLILISAVTHAGWNLAGKKQVPDLAFFAVALLFGVVVLLPVVLPQIHLLSRLPSDIWPMLILGALAQAIYHGALADAYKQGDLSMVYPMVRALPLVFTALASVALGRGSALSFACLWGCFFIAAGCLFLPLKTFERLRCPCRPTAAVFLALVAALGTTGYSLTDDVCIRALNQSLGQTTSRFSISLLYLFTQTVLALGLMVPATLATPSGRSDLARLRGRRLRMALVTGVGIVGTYSLVLTAMNFAADVTYVVAFRQLSIPFGALLGFIFLREEIHPPRLLGLAAVCLGLVLVALG